MTKSNTTNNTNITEVDSFEGTIFAKVDGVRLAECKVITNPTDYPASVTVYHKLAAKGKAKAEGASIYAVALEDYITPRKKTVAELQAERVKAMQAEGKTAQEIVDSLTAV